MHGSSWCHRSDTRTTLWQHYSVAPGILCKSQSSPKCCTKSSSTFSATMPVSRVQRGQELSMRMELIQPFINAADAVLADSLQCPTSIGHLSMDEEAYRRKGVAARIAVSGDIEGRIIFDVDPHTAMRVASRFAGEELPESDDLMRET